jgi:O-acetyl-ADP-ribose deacetylase (regulator of RNase III)
MASAAIYPQPELSYYEKARRQFIAAPFENERAKETFKVPLKDWGKVCESAKEERRKFYRVDKYVTPDEFSKNASLQCQIASKKSGKVLDVFITRTTVSKIEADAAINPANETLLGGGGGDKEIHDGAGPNLVKECAHIKGGCDVGKAKVTKGYDLPAKYVIHTVGPLLKSDGKGDDRALKSCYTSSLALCDKLGLESISIPCVACGFYAFPLPQSAAVVRKTLEDYADSDTSTVKTAVLCVPRDIEWEAYSKEFNNLKKESPSPAPVASSEYPGRVGLSLTPGDIRQSEYDVPTTEVSLVKKGN